ncbi:unnamed protein product [Lathyrus sativus]|nr:unnamed protein product [Lathyrus sativus]
MESTNFHHLQDQQPHLPVSSLSSPIPCSYAVGGTTTIHSWTPTNITLNNAAGNFNSNLQEVDPRYSRSSTTIQDLGYHHHQWTNDDVKEEISFANFPKFTEMLNYTPPNLNMENYGILEDSSTTIQMKNSTNDEHKDMNALMLKNLYTGGDFYSNQNYPNIGNQTQIHPSINISNLNHYSSSSTTSTLDMNMQSLDLLSSSQDHHLGRFTTNDHENLSFHLHPMQNQLANRSSSSNSINKPSLLGNGGGETKRVMQSKASQSETALKKSRSSSESRPPSCAPFKVRKEKLGDRIAALQQLVAPFGKTDTASVLMEAIGYIKFLQGQVETLSVPYMKSSQNQNNRLMQGDLAIGDTNGEPKQYLRSRGLCLVPLSCMSYIAGDGSSEVWQQRPNFGGPT